MANAALELLEDADVHRTQSEAVRERAVSEFAQGNVLGRYEELYRRVLDATD